MQTLFNPISVTTLVAVASGGAIGAILRYAISVWFVTNYSSSFPWPTLIANAIGAYKNYKTSCLVVDFGTATTFDVVKKPGIYDGGVIAPGIKTSIINLNKSTALLPILNLKSISKKYGKNTKDALNAGFLWGYQGLINNIIKKITVTSKIKYKIILTGGYAYFFKKFVNNKPSIDENITIKGIIEIYKKLLK